MNKLIFWSLLLAFVIETQVSAAETINMDDDPAIAQFALEVVQLNLDVFVNKPKVSTTSTLRIEVWLINEGPKPFDLLLNAGGMMRPYSLSLVSTTGDKPWGLAAAKVGISKEKIVIQPGEHYEDILEVDLREIKGLKTGAYIIDASIIIVRDIGGERRSVHLMQRSRAFQIDTDPPDLESPVLR